MEALLPIPESAIEFWSMEYADWIGLYFVPLFHRGMGDEDGASLISTTSSKSGYGVFPKGKLRGLKPEPRRMEAGWAKPTDVHYSKHDI